jgi:hypothetical protein
LSVTPEAVAVAGCESVSDAGPPLMLAPLTMAGLEMVQVVPSIEVIVLPPGKGLGLAGLQQHGVPHAVAHQIGSLRRCPRSSQPSSA